MKFTVSIKRNYEFQRLYHRGKSNVNSYLAVYYRKTRRTGNRLGITVGKKVGKAVVRNRVRRRIREIYRLHEDELSRGCELVIVARVKAAFASYRQLEQAYLSLADRLGLWDRGASEP